MKLNIDHKQTAIKYQAGTKVRILEDYQDNEYLRGLVLTVQHHSLVEDIDMSENPFIDNHLYTDAFQYVGPFGNWELEAVRETK